MYGPREGLIPLGRKRQRKKVPGVKHVLIGLFLITCVGLLAGLGTGAFDSPGTSPAQTPSDNPNNAYPVPSGEVDSYEGGSPPFVATAVGADLDSVQLVETVGPAVVSIVTETVSQGWFLQPTPQRGAGTGAILSPDGHIVTNNHVVEGAQKVMVTLNDGRTFEAAGVARDPQTDLAVIKIDASDLPYLHILSNSLDQLNELDEVVAVGNALALPGGP
ncbi:S1C family serine protease, partial [Chloroflexota bacterium]